MINKALFVGFSTFLAWCIWLANTGESNLLLQVVRNVPLGDKIGHFFAMGTLAYLVNMLLKCRVIKIGPYNILMGTVLVAVIVFLEECSQLFIPSRTFSLFDLLFDAIGIWFFSRLAMKKKN